MFEMQSDDDRGVSPVIGVILMVAITVILAAVIATFVLGLGEQIGNTGPTADFSFDYDGEDDLTITFSNGQTIEAENLIVTGANPEDAWDETHSTIGAGDSVTVNTEGDETVRVVWESGSQSSTLAEWRE